MIDMSIVFERIKALSHHRQYSAYINELLQKNSTRIHEEVDRLYASILSGHMREKGIYQYAGRAFTIDNEVKPDNLMVWITRYPYPERRLVLVDSIEQNNETSRTSRRGSRRVTQYKLQLSELGRDGWTPLSYSVTSHLGNEMDAEIEEDGVYPLSLVYPNVEPISFLSDEHEIRRQRLLQAEQDLIEKNKEIIDNYKKGVWLTSIIDFVGNVDDTVVASSLRTWFKKNGVDATVRVKRHSMASGLSFKLKDKSETGIANLKKISTIDPRQTSLLSSWSRVGTSDSFIYYPYANQLAKIMAERHAKKSPVARGKISGFLDDKSSSVGDLLHLADPGVVSPQVYLFFGADLFERLGIIEAEIGGTEAIQSKQRAAISHLAFKIRQVAAGVITKPSNMTRWSTKQVNALGSNTAFPYYALEIAGCIIKQSPSTLPTCMRMASKKMNEFTSLGFDAGWQMGRLAYLESLWSIGGERALQLLLDGMPPIEENPTLMGGIEG